MEDVNSTLCEPSLELAFIMLSKDLSKPSSHLTLFCPHNKPKMYLSSSPFHDRGNGGTGKEIQFWELPSSSGAKSEFGLRPSKSRARREVWLFSFQRNGNCHPEETGLFLGGVKLYKISGHDRLLLEAPFPLVVKFWTGRKDLLNCPDTVTVL